MRIKKHISILFWLSFLIFIVNKLYLRNLVLKNDFSDVYDILVLSLPNFVEVVLGITVVTRIIFEFNAHLNRSLKDVSVYLISTILTAAYVISQELGYHNIGGNNTYDHYDLLASIIGLVLMFVLFTLFGFISNRAIEYDRE